jgi:hypothetical protein
MDRDLQLELSEYLEELSWKEWQARLRREAYAKAQIQATALGGTK